MYLYRYNNWYDEHAYSSHMYMYALQCYIYVRTCTYTYFFPPSASASSLSAKCNKNLLTSTTLLSYLGKPCTRTCTCMYVYMERLCCTLLKRPKARNSCPGVHLPSFGTAYMIFSCIYVRTCTCTSTCTCMYQLISPPHERKREVGIVGVAVGVAKWMWGYVEEGAGHQWRGGEFSHVWGHRYSLQSQIKF